MDKAPIPEGETLEFEIKISNGKFTVRRFKSYKWQALRYDEDWPACPYPDWVPDNLTAAMAWELAELAGKV